MGFTGRPTQTDEVRSRIIDYVRQGEPLDEEVILYFAKHNPLEIIRGLGAAGLNVSVHQGSEEAKRYAQICRLADKIQTRKDPFHEEEVTSPYGVEIEDQAESLEEKAAATFLDLDEDKN